MPTRQVLREGRKSAWVPLADLQWSADSGEQPELGENGIGELWRILNRHRVRVALVCLATVFAAALWILTTPPIYTGTAMLRIEADEPHVLTFDEILKQTDALPESLQTNLRLLQSRTLADRVITELSLDTHPDFQDAQDSQSWFDGARTWARQQFARWLPKPPAPAPGSTDNLTSESPLTRIFQSRLTIEPVRGSRLVKVSFDSHDPLLAARVANTMSQAFVAQTHEFHAETAKYASRFLTTQMEQARAKLQTAEEKLNAFLKAHNINFVAPATLLARGQTGGGTERQDLITQQLTTLSDALLKARADRMAKESLMEQAGGHDLDSLPAVLQSPLILKLKGELASNEADYRELSQTFKPEYPRMLQLQQSIGEIRSQIRAEAERVAKGLQADYRAALQNEHQIERAMDNQRAQALKLGDQMVEYRILRRDVDADQELYTSLLTRLKEAQISAGLLTSPVSIIDQAEVPLLPSHPRKTLILLLAGVVGLLGGVAVAFLAERGDPRITNADEINRLLGVPKLGLVPEIYSFGRRYAHRRQLGRGRDGGQRSFALVTHLESASYFAESFRDLRTSILYATPERPPRTLMVTSLDPGDGKTALAMNLAVSLAQLGSGKVLLVDGNMRHPELHSILQVERVPGLSALLAGEADLSTTIVSTDIPNLSFIPGGRRLGNPGDLFASHRLGEMLETLRTRFAHVIFDSPPLFGVSDALNLAPRLEGVVLVLRHGRASREDAQEAVQRLAVVRAKLLGVVVNGVDGKAITRRRRYYGVR